MALSLTYFCGIAAAIYVNTCLVVATVRWFHMCRPYNRNPRYYYPGRPFVTGAWLSSLVLLPYVLNPESADAWFLARFYFLPVTLFHFTLILFSYFGSVMAWRKWQWPVLIAGVPVVVILLGAVVLAVWPGTQIGGTPLSAYVLYIMGLLVTALCFVSIAVVYIWANRFDPDDFSNPADFPVTQARRWMVMVLVNTAICWMGALLDNPAVLAVIQLIISVSCVLFVLTVLHPNRNRPMAEPEQEQEPQPEQEPVQAAATADASSDASQRNQSSLPRKNQAEILSAIRTVVEVREAFLDPHLTLQDVADRCGYNRTYISGLVKREFGGFVDYVNRLRLAYVDDYLKQHPDATIAEAIDAAGFGSRPSYYAFKAKFQGNGRIQE